MGPVALRIKLAKEMQKHGLLLYGFKAVVEPATRMWGWCIGEPNERAIGLSESLGELPEEQIHQIILHEIAHAIDYVRNNFQWRYQNGKALIHDRTFKAICAELGCTEDKKVISF